MYEDYIERFRNLSYLEDQLEQYNGTEHDKEAVRTSKSDMSRVPRLVCRSLKYCFRLVPNFFSGDRSSAEAHASPHARGTESALMQ